MLVVAPNRQSAFTSSGVVWSYSQSTDGRRMQWDKKKLAYHATCSDAQSCPTLRNPRDCSTPGVPVLHHLLEMLRLMSMELMMPSIHLPLCCPLLLLPSVFPSISVFSRVPLVVTENLNWKPKSLILNQLIFWNNLAIQKNCKGTTENFLT